MPSTYDLCDTGFELLTLLADDFETDDLSKWAGSTHAGSNTVLAASGAAHAGSYGLRDTFDGTNANAFVYSTTGTARKDVTVEFWVRLGVGFSMGTYADLTLLTLGPNRVTFGVRQDAAGVYYFRFQQVSPWWGIDSDHAGITLGQWYRLKGRFFVDSANGGGQFWMDSGGGYVSLGTSYGNNNASHEVTLYQVGANTTGFTATVPTAGSTIDFDDVLVTLPDQPLDTSLTDAGSSVVLSTDYAHAGTQSLKMASPAVQYGKAWASAANAIYVGGIHCADVWLYVPGSAPDYIFELPIESYTGSHKHTASISFIRDATFSLFGWRYWYNNAWQQIVAAPTTLSTDAWHHVRAEVDYDKQTYHALIVDGVGYGLTAYAYDYGVDGSAAYRSQQLIAWAQTAAAVTLYVDDVRFGLVTGAGTWLASAIRRRRHGGRQ